jgi:hypothetical protein
MVLSSLESPEDQRPERRDKTRRADEALTGRKPQDGRSKGRCLSRMAMSPDARAHARSHADADAAMRLFGDRQA